MKKNHDFLPGLAAFGIAVLSLTGCGPKEETAAPPPPIVLVTAAATRDVDVHREWVGTLDGSENAEVRARVTGYLLARDYNEGSFVKKGDLLFQIDPRPFIASLAQAKSQLDQARALRALSAASQCPKGRNSPTPSAPRAACKPLRSSARLSSARILMARCYA